MKYYQKRKSLSSNKTRIQHFLNSRLRESEWQPNYFFGYYPGDEAGRTNHSGGFALGFAGHGEGHPKEPLCQKS
jgi:hypothetical protein